MSVSVGIAILAAGKGTRLKVNISKALAPALGRKMIDYVVDECLKFGELREVKLTISTVIGFKGDEVKAHLETQFPNVLNYVWQKEQKGTADALRSYFDERPENWNCEYTFVTCADTPLIQAETFTKLFDEMSANPQLQAVAGSFTAEIPFGYGRILREKKGFKIIEEKEASDEVKKIQEVNSGFYLIRTSFIKEHLYGIKNANKSGEFYLTDLFDGENDVKAIHFSDETIFQGVNTLKQLSEITYHLQARKLEELMLNGVLFLNATSNLVDWNVKVGTGSVIYPGVTLLGSTVVEEDVTIENGCIIKDSTLKSKCDIYAYSYVEKSEIFSHASIGPFARIRPETQIGEKAKIGNFVEVKKSKLAAGAKVSHLSYVGDAEVGENTNIGCGFITCNYDGVNKHKTKIGKDTFIGSDCQVIAPIEIGDRSFIGAGSTITKNVPSEAFAIARTSQVTKEKAAGRFLKIKKS